ncbi:hypothetical protein, partial [Pseudomonas atacamensis]|uniref:hypothetical protein n=1 Tax=Pseudomonas atacamensis TaxID=2565368 RepID=UPI002B1E19B2
GFIWGDGHVKGNIVTAAVKKEDGEEFLSFFGHLGNFHSREFNLKGYESDYLYFSIFNKELADYLRLLDFEEKSTVSPSKVIQTIPEDLRRFFW